MTHDSRNTRVVVCLMVSMTLGAALLMWLETPRRGWSSEAMLMAQGGVGVDAVTVEFVPADEGVPRYRYDCIVQADAAPLWEPRPGFTGHVRLAVRGTGAEQLSEAHQLHLLAVLGSMKQQRGLDLARVRLHPASDSEIHPNLPGEARHLRDLLVRKGIIR